MLATLTPFRTLPTLEELLALIDALPPAERRRLRSAILECYDLLGELPNGLIEEPHRLRR